MVNEMAADLRSCPDLSRNIATANRLPRCLQVKFNNGKKTKERKKKKRTSSPSCGEEAWGWYLLVFVILLAAPCLSLFQPAFFHQPLTFKTVIFFCLFYNSLSAFFSHPTRHTRASIGSRGRATWCPWTSRRWKSDRWEPLPAGGDDGWPTKAHASTRKMLIWLSPPLKPLRPNGTCRSGTCFFTCILCVVHCAFCALQWINQYASFIVAFAKYVSDSNLLPVVQQRQRGGTSSSFYFLCDDLRAALHCFYHLKSHWNFTAFGCESDGKSENVDFSEFGEQEMYFPLFFLSFITLFIDFF